MTQQRDILINDIIKVTVYESEVEPNCDNVKEDRWRAEEDHTRIEVEEETRLVEEARLKSEEEEV